MVTFRLPLLFFMWLTIGCGLVTAQEFSVEATVDRSTIRENESFNYTVRVEGSVRGDPEISGLDENFDVLNRSTNTRIQILNGRTEQIAEWQYQLMPRQSGTFVIPPAQIAGSVSNAVEIEVLAGLPPGDELADIFMEVEAVPTQAYVQSQIIFTLRLFVGVGTGRATLSAPSVDGIEAIVERLGEDANFSTVRNGRNFVVRERSYAIFAQQPGSLTIGPVIFEVMVIPNRGFSRVQRYSSDSVQIEVLPAVAPPPEYPQAVWLPAQRVALSERWSATPDEIEMGIPLTRALTIDADGLLETQLPGLELALADGIRQYADQPELDRSVGPAGLNVQRTERYAVIAQQAGDVELPAVELPWWNVSARQWEVARIEPRTVAVLPSTEAVGPAQEEPVETAAQPQPVIEQSRLAWWLAAFLGVGWMTTLAAWWYTARLRAGAAEAVVGKSRGSSRSALNQLQRACVVNDPEAARTALLDWASFTADCSDCTSLGALSERLPDAAADAISDLERHLYSPTGGKWDGADLAASITSLKRIRQRPGKAASDPLPSLYS